MNDGRTPLSAVPYYCKVCGAGYGEYLACDAPDCKLESLHEAGKRRKAYLKELEAQRLPTPDELAGG